MTLERKSDGTISDVAMKSTSSQHVPIPIGEDYCLITLSIVIMDFFVSYFTRV